MEVKFLGQGLHPGTGNDKPMGLEIIKSISDKSHSSFCAFDAFLSTAGATALTFALLRRGVSSLSTKLFIGVDFKGTSKKALEILLRSKIQTHIFHTPSAPTYHPKVYVFEGPKTATVFVGSSNLTMPGLSSNIEANLKVSFDPAVLKKALSDPSTIINNAYLEQFEEYRDFKARTKDVESGDADETLIAESDATPDEVLRSAHQKINASLSSDILDRVREATPVFFENLIVELLLSMGYGGTSEDTGRAIGKSGDDGVDGVIDQDPLGVDQIYIQAKRYAAGNTIGAGAIRDFFGALNLKKAQKGIFVTTSSFSSSAIQTSKDLGMRIVLIDGIAQTGCSGESDQKRLLRYHGSGQKSPK